MYLLRAIKTVKQLNKGNQSFKNINKLKYLNSNIFDSVCPLLFTHSTSLRRGYAIQSIEKEQNFSSDLNAKFSLDRELERIDSILRRGGFLHKKSIEEICEKLKYSGEVSSSQALFILRCCGSAATLENVNVRNNLVSKIWNTYLEQGIPLDISHYNALLHVFLENEYKFSPLDFLETLKERNVEPNRITYSRLIRRYCQEGDIEGANKILEFMKEKELPIGETVFNSLILGNSRARDLEGAVGILDVMKQSDLTPSPDTYATLMRAYIEHNDFEKVKNTLSQCEKEEIYLSNKSLMDLICQLAEKDQHSPLIDEFLTKMKKQDGYPTLVAYGSSHLLNSGLVETAFKIYKSMQFNEDLHYLGSFFPKHLAVADLDLHVVVQYCEEIKRKGWNILSFENALETYLKIGKNDLALGLIRVMKEKGIPLKEHYFYPLICSAAGNREKVYAIFEEMLRMKVQCNSEFIATFLLPSFEVSPNLNDCESVYNHLLGCQDVDDVSLIYNGMVEFVLRNYSIELAANFVDKHRRSVKWNLKTLLWNTYLKTKDPHSTTVILRQMLPLEIRLQRGTEKANFTDMAYDGIKHFLLSVINALIKEETLEKDLLPLLKEMENLGVGITPSIREHLVDRIGTKIQPEVKETLQNLSNLSLMLVNYQHSSGSLNANTVQSDKISLSKKIEEAEEKEEDATKLYMALLITVARQRKIDETKEIIAKLSSLGVDSLPPSVLVIILDMYVDESQLEEADKIYNTIMEENPDFRISSYNCTKYATGLVQSGRYQDAVKCLLMNSSEDGDWPENIKPNFYNPLYRKQVTNMLNAVTEKKDLPSLKLIQEALISRKFAPPNLVLSPLIDYYIKEDNLEEALREFERISEEHNITPVKELLTVAFINKEDTENIQKIMDISSRVHGEMNTLYDLMFAFIDAGKLKQAEKVLQTSGLRTLQKRLNDRCEHYLRTGKISQLEGLVSITKNLFNIDRQRLYNYLLEGFISEDSPSKALGVWTTMQEEGVEPDNLFLSELGNYLKLKGFEVPFVIPDHTRNQKLKMEEREHTRTSAGSTLPTKTDNSLVYALDSQNFEQVEKLYARSKESGQEISLELRSRVIQTMLRNQELEKGFEETKALVNENKLPSINVLHKLIENLSEAGKTAEIEFFDRYLNEKIKRRIVFRSKLCTSYIKSGRAEELLNRIIETVENDVEKSTSNFSSLPASSLIDLMEHNPELYPLVLKCAEVRKQKGTSIMYQMLFDHFFTNGKLEEAERLYNEHLSEENSIQVRFACSKSFREKNTERLEEIIKILDRKADGREKTKGFVYSCYIDILCHQEKYGEALKLTEKVLQSITLEDLRRNSLHNLRAKAEANNLTFPYNLDNLREDSSSSSSSSSSDDEKK